MARRYLVVRTARTHRDFILRELEQGRLRQGWGWKPEQDLRLLRQKVDSKAALTEDEASAWRNRRLLHTEPDGLKPDDTIIVPNLPDQGRWVMVRVSGPYRYEISSTSSEVGPDFGHVVEVTPVRDPAGKIAVVEADNAHVDARLRASMRSMSRMWSIDALGPQVEGLISAMEGGADTVTPEPEVQKFGGFFNAMRDAAWENIRQRYKGAEFEQLVLRLFQKIYAPGRVEHWGGPGEKGADLIVFVQDQLGLEYKIAVQVKLYDGQIDDLHALDQVALARDAHRVDGGVVVTTANETSKQFDSHREQLEAKLGIDIRVITRDELVQLVMTHLGAERVL